jgi:hypothetical protein
MLEKGDHRICYRKIAFVLAGKSNRIPSAQMAIAEYRLTQKGLPIIKFEGDHKIQQKQDFCSLSAKAVIAASLQG